MTSPTRGSTAPPYSCHSYRHQSLSAYTNKMPETFGESGQTKRLQEATGRSTFTAPQERCHNTVQSIIKNSQLRHPPPPARVHAKLRRQRRRHLRIPPLRPTASPSTRSAPLPPPSLQPLRLIMQSPPPLTLLHRRQTPPTPRRWIPSRQSLVAQTALLHRPQPPRDAVGGRRVGVGV